mmetsp:Transcript_44117/g.122159  ORF Transcript_44117/g.122159 Transcript_44117/m.122159 type:complete len:220 (-) Transcript_44117:28-687(-)
MTSFPTNMMAGIGGPPRRRSSAPSTICFGSSTTSLDKSPFTASASSSCNSAIFSGSSAKSLDKSPFAASNAPFKKKPFAATSSASCNCNASMAPLGSSVTPSYQWLFMASTSTSQNGVASMLELVMTQASSLNDAAVSASMGATTAEATAQLGPVLAVGEWSCNGTEPSKRGAVLKSSGGWGAVSSFVSSCVADALEALCPIVRARSARVQEQTGIHDA